MNLLSELFLTECRKKLTLLLVVFVISFIVRFLILSSFQYPPSGDAGGDLYYANLWLKGKFIGADDSLFSLNGNALLAPPLYYFLIVVPFTYLLPTFLAIKTYMAFVAALLVFPTYLLARELRLGLYMSLLTASFISMSTLFSLMISWNASFNLFGIFFYLFFLDYLLKAMTTPRRRTIVFCAMFLSLIAGSHELTLFFAVFSLIVYSVIVMISRRKILATLGTLLKIIGYALLFTIPLIPVYLASLSNLAGTRYEGEFSWLQYLSAVILFGLGQQGQMISPLVYADVFATVLSVIILIRSEYERGLLMMLTLILTVVAFPLFDSSTAVRGLYFLAIPFSFLFMMGLSKLLVFATVRLKSVLSPNISDGVLKRFTCRSTYRLLRVSLILLIASLFLGNVLFSITSFHQAISYYSELNNNSVAALDWIQRNTPNNAIIYTPSLGLLPWVAGYSQRAADGPYNSALNVVGSFDRLIQLGNYIYLGNYMIGNNVLKVAHNFPGVGTPEIYFQSEGSWRLFLQTQPDLNELTFQLKNSKLTLPLSSSVLENVSTRGDSTGIQSAIFTFLWRNWSLEANESITVENTDIAINWSSPNQLEQVQYSFRIPPSGYFFDYLSVASLKDQPSIVDSFLLGNKNLRLRLWSQGGNFSQTITESGWTEVSINSPRSFAMTISGLANAGIARTEFTNSLVIIKQLNIAYIVLSSISDYPFFTRVRNFNSTNLLAAKIVFSYADWYVFEILYKSN